MAEERRPPKDYDYEAARRAGVKPDKRGHMPDTYKRPNHITFSDESRYHGVDGNEGGQWRRSQGQWSFTPGATNLQHHTRDEMRDYMRRNEPESLYHEPAPPTEYKKGGRVAKRDTRNYGKKGKR